MKKQTNRILLFGILLAFAACTQSTNNNVSLGTVMLHLNATETQLAGTWYVSEQDKQYYIGSVPSTYQDTFKPGTAQYYADSNYQDTYFSATGNSIQFTADQFSSSSASDSNYKQVYDASYGLSTQGYALPITGDATNFWWYYDNSTSSLIINTRQFQIVSLTATNLVITNTLTGNPYTLVYTCYLHK